MKKLLIYFLITIAIIIAVFFIITRNGLPKLSINDIKSVNISRGLVPIKELDVVNNRVEIENLVSMYNRSKRSYQDGDTTPEIDIVFQLKDNKELSIQGNTQSFQYVYVNNKHYKITGKDLTIYIRNLCQ
ncbi:hypothetical protein [Candidatus Clostridium stratigraminis]|uniref:Uncharacterized protein n=1 Tax=Candidatus Clostridium stratigraminis TaxID=3381661 RepID=A0ABW8T3J1_9CLOT